MTEVNIFENIMSRNDVKAAENKKAIGKALAINMMSSPGAGKTTLLETMLGIISKKYDVGVIEGDIATSEDAKRLKKHAKAVYQIKTENYGGGCHLDAKMVATGLKKIKEKSKKFDLIIMENVGNLICPADFSLGEDKKVVMLSVTEGAEKPIKYPLMFEMADVMLLSKTDLLPYVDFDVEKMKANVKKVNKKLKIIELSAKDGSGVSEWVKWLEKNIDSKSKKWKG